jgi:aminobenzoyl-glutamate transport protein
MSAPGAGAEIEAGRLQSGVLGWIERLGNKVPDPAMIFVWLIGVLVLVSIIGAAQGWSASLTYSGEKAPDWGELADGTLTYRATSLLTEENVTRLFVEMPKTFTGFAPLGLILTIMLGAAVAERSGLFSAMIRAALRNASRSLLTPIVALIGILSHFASDAAYVVFLPLAAIVFASAGRHPLAGMAAAFAAVSGGLAANITPTQLDVLLFGFTQEAARIVDPAWRMNPLGNWFYTFSATILFVPLIWLLTDRVIEPRLGKWQAAADDEDDASETLAQSALDADERRGLARAGLAALVVAAGIAALVLIPSWSPLYDDSAQGPAALQPFFGAMVPAFTLLFLVPGIVFGRATGRITSSRDVMDMMQDGLRSLAPYIAFTFFAAHFVAMFNWSRLGPILAINGAQWIASFEMPKALLLVAVQMMSSVLDLFIGSASAKWSALSPVVVPMFMLLGISPEMTTAAYRMGDSYTNIMTPLMNYFPLVLAFAQRWDRNFGVGSLLALMLPYALCFMVVGVGMTVSWVVFDLPLGPGAQVFYARPAP